MPTKFCILGAGAIGSYVGASLIRGGAQVVMVGRGRHLEAMQKNGLQINSPRGDFHVSVEATNDITAIADAEVVFMSLKAYAIPEVAPRLSAVLDPRCSIIAAQNGIPWWYFQSAPGPLTNTVVASVDPGGIISKSIPHECVIGCVIYCSAEVSSPGVIRHVEGTRFTLGEPNGLITQRCSEIANAFVAGGLKCHVESKLRDQIWLKLLGSAAFNPVSALTRATMGEMGRFPEVRGLLRLIMEEVSHVSRALEITIPVGIDRRLEAGFAVGEHKTSMLQDLEAGKRLEIECLTGAVIELADRLGLPVPHLRTVDACVRLREATASGALVMDASFTGEGTHRPQLSARR